jgi:hypothetical protein
MKPLPRKTKNRGKVSYIHIMQSTPNDGLLFPAILVGLTLSNFAIRSNNSTTRASRILNNSILLRKKNFLTAFLILRNNLLSFIQNQFNIQKTMALFSYTPNPALKFVPPSAPRDVPQAARPLALRYTLRGLRGSALEITTY